ncbi:helix-turn-helix domain-containing protein [Cryobacterium aureum]|uniref:helix-turn-helix domain-containing protein n=1 Tax=Cryobacterium aureum TaxID=995037 RepID=UPI00196AA794|nr:helix-turn-helix transcriptional regulator [Cryobacterium aureum]
MKLSAILALFSVGVNRQANAAPHRIVLLRKCHKQPRTVAFIARGADEGLYDRDSVRCRKRNVANDICALFTQNPAVSLPRGPRLRQRRQTLDIVITDAAKELNVRYQRLRRLEIGRRNDTNLETTFSAWLDEQPRQSDPTPKAAGQQ